MAGLSRFDFYPRDWHLDTRDLSNAAKGVYIDLLSSMYARGGPLPYDERELCQLCGCATVRSLRPLLGELINKGKLRIVDGCLENGRAMEEIAKAERIQAIVGKGGKAKANGTANDVQPEYELNSSRTQPEYELNSSRTQPETRSDIEENQKGNVCSPSPSPSPSITEEDKSSSAADAAFRPSDDDLKKLVFDVSKPIIGGGQVNKLIGHFKADLRETHVSSCSQNKRLTRAPMSAGSWRAKLSRRATGTVFMIVWGSGYERRYHRDQAPAGRPRTGSCRVPVAARHPRGERVVRR
jgi:uncharacterized protein YdaU (DUF1376 family)